jgi:RNA polymerase sigma-70 factor, ECF subfamily
MATIATDLRNVRALKPVAGRRHERAIVATKALSGQPRVAKQDIADADLLERIAEGDRTAIQTLFSRHNQRVYRFVLRFVDDRALAEDLVNEVFAEIWRNAARFKGDSRVSTWMLAIARLKAISSLRRRKDGELDEAAAAAIPDLADDPEVMLQKKDRVAILRQCLSHLSSAHREIIDLTYYQEKSVHEVAAIVGVPTNTVKTRIFYARKRMLELLQEVGIDRTYQ